MEYVWDEGKNASNIAKHHMDFSTAYRVFEQAMLIAQDDREDYGEIRYIGFGRLDERVVVVIYTEPDENTTRIIFVAESHRAGTKTL